MYTSMGGHFIGVVRSARSLHALTLETRDAEDPALPWKVDKHCVLRPLVDSQYDDAWQALAAVSRWDETTLGHLLTVLRASVPCADAPSDLPALGRDVHAPPPPRATAAHPRAFRGTKYRPPRPVQPDPVDIRPYLLTRRHTDQVLDLLGQRRNTDIYVAWNHRVETTATFDPIFVSYLLPLFKDCTWSEVGAFAALARSLELHRLHALRAELSHLFVVAGDPTRALGWWNHVLAHDAARRLEAAQLVSASGAANHDPIDPDVAARVAALPPLTQWWFYRGLAAGAAAVYLESGLALGVAYGEPAPPGQHDVTTLVETTVERLDAAIGAERGIAFWRGHLWELCGYQPELVDLLATPIFASLHPNAAFRVILTASTPRCSPESAAEEWRELAPLLPRFVEFASQVTLDYQSKFAAALDDVYGWSIIHAYSAINTIAKCVEICLKIAAPPFSTEGAYGWLLPYVALCHDDSAKSWKGRRRIVNAPDASWLALESACTQRNQVNVIAPGLNRISRFAPELLMASFATHPGALLQTAEVLEAVSFESAMVVLQEYERSRIADAALEHAPLATLCEVIAPVARAGGPNPVRRALRLHLAGVTSLTDAQVRGHHERIIASLDLIRLASIRQHVERLLAAKVGVQKLETPVIRHAVAMLTIEAHRRQLRRMLTATLAGDKTWSLRHPRSLAWFAQHPKVNPELWLKGVELRGELEGIGEVRIAVEQDPLEALKLGTYVGSCLGRGGQYEYSAAAVVLDVNKQVVYARDKRGTVVGRQLVAISQSDELVCFSVYGAAARALEPLFRDYDRALSSALGLPLYGSTAEPEDYEVARILSHQWVDDDAWREVEA